MHHLKTVVVSQLIKGQTHECFELGDSGNNISIDSKAYREHLFGRFGNKLVEVGPPITNHLGNYNGWPVLSKLIKQYGIDDK